MTYHPQQNPGQFPGDFCGTTFLTSPSRKHDTAGQQACPQANCLPDPKAPLLKLGLTESRTDTPLTKRLRNRRRQAVFLNTCPIQSKNATQRLTVTMRYRTAGL